MSKLEMRKEEEKWRAESDMRTLLEAEKIKGDPKRLKAAKEQAKCVLMEMATVAGAPSSAPADKT